MTGMNLHHEIASDPRARRVASLMAADNRYRRELHGHAYDWVKHAAQAAAIHGLDYRPSDYAPESLLEWTLRRWIKPAYRDAYQTRIASLVASAQLVDAPASDTEDHDD